MGSTDSKMTIMSIQFHCCWPSSSRFCFWGLICSESLLSRLSKPETSDSSCSLLTLFNHSCTFHTIALPFLPHKVWAKQRLHSFALPESPWPPSLLPPHEPLCLPSFSFSIFSVPLFTGVFFSPHAAKALLLFGKVRMGWPTSGHVR